MDSPFSLFKKKEEKKELEEREVQDLNKLKPMDDILPPPEEMTAPKQPEPVELMKPEEAPKLEELPKPSEEILPPYLKRKLSPLFQAISFMPSLMLFAASISRWISSTVLSSNLVPL